MEKGLVHIYTGDGKGKTTAAVGLATRALGQGLRVGFFQFLKSGFSGEMFVLSKSGATFMAPQGSGKFVWEMNDEEKQQCKTQQQGNFDRAVQMQEQFDVLVLDEVIGAITTGMLDEADVLEFVKNKPEAMELVMTGRGASEKLLKLADYITEMRCIKHPYTQNVTARKGIEF